jgi:hypothetical protein
VRSKLNVAERAPREGGVLEIEPRVLVGVDMAKTEHLALEAS